MNNIVLLLVAIVFPYQRTCTTVEVKTAAEGNLNVPSGTMSMVLDKKTGDLFVTGQKSTHTISKIPRATVLPSSSTVPSVTLDSRFPDAKRAMCGDTRADPVALPRSSDNWEQVSPKYMKVVYLKDTASSAITMTSTNFTQLRCLVFADGDHKKDATNSHLPGVTNDTTKLYIVKTDPKVDSSTPSYTIGAIIDPLFAYASSYSSPTNKASKIVGIEVADTDGTNDALVFVAVAPQYDTNDELSGEWGQDNSGIAVFQVSYKSDADGSASGQEYVKKHTNVNSTSTAMASAITTTYITTARVDRTQAALYLNNSLSAITNDGTDTYDPILHWDNDLQRLYVGLKEVISGQEETDGAKSILVGAMGTAQGTLTRTSASGLFFQPLTTNDTAWGTGQTDVQNNLVCARYKHQKLSLHNLTTMKTPDGKYYLVINGGVGSYSETFDNVYALPLAYVADLTNVATGTLAKCAVSSGVATVTFTAQAANSTAITAGGENELLSAANFNSAAIYGPRDPNVTPINANINAVVGFQLPPTASSDCSIVAMKSSGEAVYALIGKSSYAENAEAEAGLFVSHAIFDVGGVITRWGSWNKISSPVQTSSSILLRDFEIDAPSGKIYTIVSGKNASEDNVLRSNIAVAKSGTLGSVIKSAVSDSSSQAVMTVPRNHLNSSYARRHISRYMAVSGDEKVTFFRLATTPQTDKDYSIRSIQKPVYEYSSAANKLQVAMPELPVSTLKCRSDRKNIVNCLGYGYTTGMGSNALSATDCQYTKSVNADAVFFLAGTDEGLYILGHGFNEADMYKDFTQAPWKDSQWRQVLGKLQVEDVYSVPADQNQTVAVTKFKVRSIKTIGAAIYVLVRKEVYTEKVHEKIDTVVPTQVDQLYRFDENLPADEFSLGERSLLIADTTGVVGSGQIGVGVQINDFVVVKATNNASSADEHVFILADTGSGEALFASAAMNNSTTTTTVPTWADVDLGGLATVFLDKLFPGVHSALDGSNHTFFISALPLDSNSKSITTRSQMLRILSKQTITGVAADLLDKDWNSSNAAKTGYIDYVSGVSNLPRVIDLYNDGLRRLFVTQLPDGSIPGIYLAPYRTDIWKFSETTRRITLRIPDTVLGDPDKIFWIAESPQGELLISVHGKNKIVNGQAVGGNEIYALS